MLYKFKFISIAFILILTIAVFIVLINVIQIFNKERDPKIILSSVIQLQMNKSSIIEVNNTEYITKSDSKYLKEFMKKMDINMRKGLVQDFPL
ncbi:MAG TPA: hypothetical protein VIK72_06850 [Clostridiaceae bacterium]